MRMLRFGASAAVAFGLLMGPASADPGKDESGKGRWKGETYRSYDSPGGNRYGTERPRRERRAFKQEYDDGNCKVERKLEKSGEYKEEVKCRRAPSYSYRY